MYILSDPIKLNPGFQYEGQMIGEAQVRMLTYGELEALEEINDITERQKTTFRKHIHRLGTVKEPSADVLKLLYPPHIARIDRAIAELNHKFCDSAEPDAGGYCGQCGYPIRARSGGASSPNA